MIARFTQVDYDRDMALVALPFGEDGAEQRIVGVARYVREIDDTRCEFAIVIDGRMARTRSGTGDDGPSDRPCTDGRTCHDDRLRPPAEPQDAALHAYDGLSPERLQ
jgi:hypothetical protein